MKKNVDKNLLMRDALCFLSYELEKTSEFKKTGKVIFFLRKHTKPQRNIKMTIEICDT